MFIFVNCADTEANHNNVNGKMSLEFLILQYNFFFIFTIRYNAIEIN